MSTDPNTEHQPSPPQKKKESTKLYFGVLSRAPEGFK